jgi:hypothetical protein
MTKARDIASATTPNANAALLATFPHKNLIINGAMQVAQRGTSATGVGGNASYPTLDRFRQNTSNTAGRFTMSQVAVTDLPGFANALKLECTTADTSIAANELGIIMQRIEGQDLQQLKKGTSSAEPVTVSFYVKGNASATYTLELSDNDNNRQISQTFSVTTSWNRVSLTFAGDTSGVLDDDNGNSLELNIWIHAGSDFNGGTLSTTWTSTTNANRASSSATSFFDSTSRTLEITGLQVELGSQATSFEHRSYGEELALCQRYFQKISGAASRAYTSDGYWGYGITSPVTMRSTPTTTNPSYTGDYSLPGTGPSFKANTVDHVSMQYNGSAGTYWAYSAEVTRDSEL